MYGQLGLPAMCSTAQTSIKGKGELFPHANLCDTLQFKQHNCSTSKEIDIVGNNKAQVAIYKVAERPATISSSKKARAQKVEQTLNTRLRQVEPFAKLLPAKLKLVIGHIKHYRMPQTMLAIQGLHTVACVASTSALHHVPLVMPAEQHQQKPQQCFTNALLTSLQSACMCIMLTCTHAYGNATHTQKVPALQVIACVVCQAYS